MHEQPGAAAATAAATAGAAAASQAVLPWMRVPLSISAGSGVPLTDVQGLHPALLRAVQDKLGFVELFPVQAAVWRGLAGGHSTEHDMCICAPTGSGKTLAYALPMLNAILTGCPPSSCHVLRGLVVLPTRSLAVQVHAVLHSLGAAAGIQVALAAAQEGVAAEAAKLVTHPSQPGTGPHVVVATPGRLMAHLQGSRAGTWGSPGGHSSSVLSLTHLKFLVVDEADRLLRQDYHGWLPQVLEQIQAAGSSSSGGSSQYQLLPELHPGTGNVLPGGQVTASAAAWGPAVYSDLQTSSLGFGSSSLQDATSAGGSSSSSSSSRHVLKLVVSATLTRDPSKLMRLELCCPRYIALTDVALRYMLPPALEQYRLVVPAQHKPLALVGLLHRLGQARTVIFASSLDMTHKLYLLLAAVPGLPGTVAEYSSHVTPAAQAAALSGFKEGRVQTLVTSDAMARGMDVSGIACVVNYDPPTYPKTYIHRAGRTARAGSAGAVYSLLKPEDVVHFNSMVRKMQGAKLQQVKLLPAELQELRPALKAALQHVQELVQLEQQQERQQVPEKRKPQPSHQQQQQQQQHVQQHEEQEQQQQQANQERPGSWKQSHNAAHSHHHDADLNVDNGSAAAAASRHKPKKHKKGKLAKQSNP